MREHRNKVNANSVEKYIFCSYILALLEEQIRFMENGNLGGSINKDDWKIHHTPNVFVSSAIV